MLRSTTCLALLSGWVWVGPTRDAAAAAHTIRAGETLARIAARRGCSTAELVAANRLRSADSIRAGQRLQIPEDCKGGRGHVVKSGETLGQIARQVGCSAEELVAANGLASPDRLALGQLLTIPTCSGPARAPRPGGGCSWTRRRVDSSRLKTRMRKRGFHPPKRFRALVVEITLSKDGQSIVGQRLFDYANKSWQHRGWNPASTVKLYSAVGALETVRAYGMGTNVGVTFHYDKRKGKGARTFRLRALFEQAMHLSKNVPHDRLVQLAGFDALNGPRGTLARAGLEHSYVMRAYAQDKWIAEGHSRSLRRSPRITLRQGKRKRTIPARRGKGKYPCGSAACTTLSDLAKMMCVMMLHEQLPPGRRLRLGRDGQSPHLKMLRQAMQRRKGGTDRVWDMLARKFPPEQGYHFFRKAGYSQDWLSENLYIYRPGSRKRWIITMAGYPGRGALTGATRIIADIIRAGDL